MGGLGTYASGVNAPFTYKSVGYFHGIRQIFVLVVRGNFENVANVANKVVFICCSCCFQATHADSVGARGRRASGPSYDARPARCTGAPAERG